MSQVLANRKAPRYLSRQSMRLLAQFLAGAASVFFALRVIGHVDRFVVVWPVSAVCTGLLLPRWKLEAHNRFSSVIAGFLGAFTGCLTVGMPWWFATTIAALTAVDVVLSCLAMGTAVYRFDDLKHTPNLARFGLACILGPATTALLGALPVSGFLHEPALRTLMMSALANSLGMGLLLPTVLFLHDAEYRNVAVFLSQKRVRRQAAAATGFFLATVIFTFTQNFGPFLFMVFPPVILLLLITGLEGAMLASFGVTLVGWLATTHGHGPIWLMRGVSA